MGIRYTPFSHIINNFYRHVDRQTLDFVAIKENIFIKYTKPCTEIYFNLQLTHTPQNEQAYTYHMAYFNIRNPQPSF